MKLLALALASALALSPAAFAQCNHAAKASEAKLQTTRHDAAPKAKTTANIVETAQAAGAFNTLIAAAVAADLGGVLSEGGPFTVFAPTDAAFAALPAGTVETLLKPQNKAQLAAILTYHVLPGKVKAADLVGKVTTFTTVNGQTLTVDGTHGVSVNGVDVVTADVKASNGIIHVIGSVLLPPAA
jgi:uncharacterized surface protein with fasciclin (FAS1) repeats